MLLLCHVIDFDAPLNFFLQKTEAYKKTEQQVLDTLLFYKKTKRISI